MKVFLGGTCNGSHWREALVDGLAIDWFNPVVEHWTEACQAEELHQRADCDFCLYVITPKMTGFYAIAELVEDSIRRPERMLLCVLAEDGGEHFSAVQLQSLQAISAMVQRNTGRAAFTDLASLRSWLNAQAAAGG